MPLKTFFISTLTSLALAGAPAPSSLTKVQSSWDKTTSFQASFKQTIKAKKMGTTDESTGEVTVQKPGKIRWDVKSERKLQILNGRKLVHIHFPKRRKANVVDIYENITNQIDIKSLSFLSGTDEFKKAYVMKITKESPKMVEVKFTPKDLPKGDTYIAEFDKESYLLRSLVTESADSTVRIEFSDIKTNIAPEPELFDYKPGPTDVVTKNK